jgi:phage terminase large subunit-like protein
MEELRRELMGFPDTRHDDQVDSISQFLEFMATPIGQRLVQTERPRGRERPRPQGFAFR